MFKHRIFCPQMSCQDIECIMWPDNSGQRKSELLTPSVTGEDGQAARPAGRPTERFVAACQIFVSFWSMCVWCLGWCEQRAVYQLVSLHVVNNRMGMFRFLKTKQVKNWSQHSSELKSASLFTPGTQKEETVTREFRVERGGAVCCSGTRGGISGTAGEGRWSSWSSWSPGSGSLRGQRRMSDYTVMSLPVLAQHSCMVSKLTQREKNCWTPERGAKLHGHHHMTHGGLRPLVNQSIKK